MSREQASGSPIALALTLVLACAGDDTGSTATEVETTDMTASGSASDTGSSAAKCIESTTVLAVDATSALDFSAAEFLADKVGQRTTTLIFPDDPASLSDLYRGKSFALEVDLRHDGGEVRWIDSVRDPEAVGGTDGEEPCEPRLEIDLALDLVTPEGPLDEHRQATMWATAVKRGIVELELAPPGIMGDLDPATLYSDPEWMVEGVNFTGIWDGTDAGGALWVSGVFFGGPGLFRLADWGDVIEL